MTDKSFSDEAGKDQRGSAEDAEPRFLVIGEVIKPHGVRGEVRVRPHTDLPERFAWLEVVYVGKESPKAVAVTAARLHQGLVLLKLDGVNNRDEAEALRGAWLQVPEAEAIPLEEGEYFLYQLEGLAVFTDAGRALGVVVEILETKANNVLVVKGPLGEVLIPDIDDVIDTVDLENGRIIIKPMPGLLPE